MKRRTLLLPAVLCAALAAPAAAQSAFPAETPARVAAAAECDTLHVFRIFPGASYTNRCAANTFVVSAPFYDRLLRDYNTLPALQDARTAQRQVTAMLEEKFVVLDSSYQALRGLNRQLSDVSIATLNASIQSIDTTRQTLTRASKDLDDANKQLKQSIRDLNKARFRSFLRIAGAFAGGLVVGLFAGQL